MATSYDYAPLFRSSVGFDRIFSLLENAQRARSISDWPPYDIVKTSSRADRSAEGHLSKPIRDGRHGGGARQHHVLGRREL